MWRATLAVSLTILHWVQLTGGRACCETTEESVAHPDRSKQQSASPMWHLSKAVPMVEKLEQLNWITPSLGWISRSFWLAMDAWLSHLSAASPLSCPRLMGPVIPEVIVLVGATINHLCAVSSIRKLTLPCSLSDCVIFQFVFHSCSGCKPSWCEPCFLQRFLLWS